MELVLQKVIDRSSDRMQSSYIPGCLNGQFAKDSSSSCAAFETYTGLTSDTKISQTVKMGGGSQLLLRYKTKDTITNGKSINIYAWNGGNISVNMKIWLSTHPTARYDQVPKLCKASAAESFMISTASQESITTTQMVWGKEITTTFQYCKLLPNTVYYFGIEFPEVVSGYKSRFQVNEHFADFLR